METQLEILKQITTAWTDHITFTQMKETTYHHELKFIIGHKPPTFNVPFDWHIITTDPNKKIDFFVEDDFVWTKNGHRDAFGEFSDLIPLARTLRNYSDLRNIRIAQYRKVVVNANCVSMEQTQWDGFYLIKTQDFEKFKLNCVTQPESHKFLFSEALILNTTLLDHYKQYHHIEDFLKFVSDCINCEVLSSEDANLLLHMNKIIIGGIGLGSFPIEVFLSVMQKVETAVSHYYTHSWINRQDSYQYRNINFLCERLSSFLLIKELDKRNIKLQTTLGRLFVITEDGKYISGGK